jgi:hypothetical protein
MKYPSKLKMRLTDESLYRAFRKFPGELDKIFPPRIPLAKNITEADVRTVAKKYSRRQDFYDCEVDMYEAAEKLGIVDDLGFVQRGGYKRDRIGALYAARLCLTTGEDAVLFGISNRHPYARYSLSDLEKLSDGVFYKFQMGGAARDAETHLKSVFKSSRAKCGQSPLQDKVGTSGEIVVGIPLDSVLSELSKHCGGVLPQAECWGVTARS